MNWTSYEVRLAFELYRVGAVKFGAFKLKLHETRPEAPLSPIYLNLRTPDNPKPGPLAEEHVRLAGEVLYARQCAARLAFSHVTGVPRAGEPFAEALHQILARRECDLIRLDKTEGGDRRLVSNIREGSFMRGDTVLLVDDLITKADSKIEAIKVLEANGLRVSDVLVLVDRGQGGERELKTAGYALHAVFTLTGLLDFYVEHEFISDSKRDEIVAYVRSTA